MCGLLIKGGPEDLGSDRKTHINYCDDSWASQDEPVTGNRNSHNNNMK